MKASPDKRKRITKKAIDKASGNKKVRLENKLAYLGTLPASARFVKGSKGKGEGGWSC